MAYTTINKSTDYFNTTLWSGNNTSPRTITTNVDNDLVWVKNRSNAYSHYLLDSVRGVGTSSDGKQLRSDSNSGNITATANGYISGLSNTGFTLTAGSGDFERLNANGMTYCAWTWKGNGAGSSNSDGDITSTVSADTTAGFSIVKFTANGTNNGTIGHGLGAAPKIIFYKRTDGTGDWYVVYKFVDGSLDFLKLNAMDAKQDLTLGTYGFSTSTTITNLGFVNSQEYIAYCFAEKQGYSKIGNYTGNGDTSGTFVYTGFKPAMIIAKNTSATQDWVIKDNKRPGFNQINDVLYPNGNYVEGHGADVDFLSNGFKMRSTANNINADGQVFIYMAFAEEPLVANVGSGVPATAR